MRVDAMITDPGSLAAEVEARRPQALLAALSGESSPMLGALEQLDVPRPWKVSFSYGRALQDPALEACSPSRSSA